MENRHGLMVDAQVTQAAGTAEREAAIDMAGALSGTHRVTLGADKNYDTQGCVGDLRRPNGTPHVAQNNQFVSEPGILDHAPLPIPRDRLRPLQF